MKLIDLVGEIIELSVMFGGGYHFDAVGRVRHCGEGTDSAALWVGAFCCPIDAEVDDRINGYGDKIYIMHVRQTAFM